MVARYSDCSLISKDGMLRGKVWKYGKNVNTDVIIPARYCNTADPAELAKHCMEDLDPNFARQVQPGDIIVAGSNFGCGSSREVAPISIKAAGVAAIVAESFARIFYRNAINIGLPIFECPQASADIEHGDIVEVDPATGIIRDITKGTEYRAMGFPEFVQQIIAKGGLMPYVEERLAQMR